MKTYLLAPCLCTFVTGCAGSDASLRGSDTAGQPSDAGPSSDDGGPGMPAGSAGPIPAGAIFVDGNLPSDCPAANYSITGRSCQGTDGRAYRTVHAAVAAASPGATVLVRGATYRELVLRGGPARSSSFLINKSMTIKGYEGEEAILTYDPANLPHEDTDLGPIVLIGASDVTFEHFTIHGTHPLGDNPIQ